MITQGLDWSWSKELLAVPDSTWKCIKYHVLSSGHIYLQELVLKTGGKVRKQKQTVTMAMFHILVSSCSENGLNVIKKMLASWSLHTNTKLALSLYITIFLKSQTLNWSFGLQTVCWSLLDFTKKLQPSFTVWGLESEQSNSMPILVQSVGGFVTGLFGAEEKPAAISATLC